MSIRKLPGRKFRLVLKANNITAYCEAAVQKMQEPRRHTTLWASTDCYMDSFNFTFLPPHKYVL
jgi:hypothetical protein